MGEGGISVHLPHGRYMSLIGIPTPILRLPLLPFPSISSQTMQ